MTIKLQVRENDAEPVKVLLWSGGIDSTYMIYRALMNGENIHVHHISMRNSEKRADHEKIAITALKEEFKNMGLSFDFSTSSVDYTETYIGFDYHMYLLLGQKACIAQFKPAQICIGRNKDDIDTVDPDIISGLYKYWTVLTEYVSPTHPYVNKKVLCPLKDLTKKEIINGLPKNLLNLCWSCRTPNGNNPCGSCKTCKEIGHELNS